MSAGRLPNLLVAGVPKAGTGSLFSYLTQHHEICGADEKEVGYFNFYNPRRHTGRPPPVDSYRQHFEHCGNQRYAVEATPTYSYGGAPVLDAIQDILGRPKIIISLRDPADRLWSAYTFQRGLGNLMAFGSFDEYLSACESRRRDGGDLVPRDHLHGLYIGYYADYISLWLDAFGDDLKVVFAEQISSDAARVVAGLFGWLDVDPTATSRLDLAPRNTTHHARSQRAAKLIYSLKRSGDRLGVLPARVRTPLRHAYERINKGASPEQMNPDTRTHVLQLYRDSNRETAKALRARGYADLPPWLLDVQQT